MYLIIHSEVPNAKLPRSHRIRSHGLSISCLHMGLVEQLSIDCVNDDPLLASGEPAQVVLGVRRILNVVGQSMSLFALRSKRLLKSSSPAISLAR